LLQEQQQQQQQQQQQSQSDHENGLGSGAGSFYTHNILGYTFGYPFGLKEDLDGSGSGHCNGNSNCNSSTHSLGLRKWLSGSTSSNETPLQKHYRHQQKKKMPGFRGRRVWCGCFKVGPGDSRSQRLILKQETVYNVVIIGCIISFIY